MRHGRLQVVWHLKVKISSILHPSQSVANTQHKFSAHTSHSIFRSVQQFTENYITCEWSKPCILSAWNKWPICNAEQNRCWRNVITHCTPADSILALYVRLSRSPLLDVSHSIRHSSTESLSQSTTSHHTCPATSNILPIICSCSTHTAYNRARSRNVKAIRVQRRHKL